MPRGRAERLCEQEGTTWIPANVSLKARVMITAEFANEVDAVNEYASTMYAATANGESAAERERLRDNPALCCHDDRFAAAARHD